MNRGGFGLLKSLVTKLLDRQVLSDVLVYLISEYRISKDTQSFINYVYYTLEQIKDNFLENEEKFLSDKRRALRNNKDLIPDTYIEFSSQLDEIINVIKSKKKAIEILLNLINTRSYIIENLKQTGAVPETLEDGEKYEFKKLPRRIYEEFIFDDADLRLYFGLSHEDLVKLVKIPPSQSELNNLQIQVKLTIDKWHTLFKFSEIYNKYEEYLFNFEISEFSSFTEFAKKFEDFLIEIKLLLTSIEKENELLGNANTDTNNKFKNSGFFVANDESSDEILSDFISAEYTVYKTGKVFWDGRIGGIESGSLVLLGAPSNHGKSIFLINLSKDLIENNLHLFNENDAILFVTLEDSKLKLTRRLLTIFGNYNFTHIKTLYNSLNALIQYTKTYHPELLSKTKQEVKNIFKELRGRAILNVTKGKVNFVIRDASNSSEKYSVVDLMRDVEKLKNEYGLNVKLVIIDYLNEMQSIKGYSDTYKEQGEITRELRKFANTHMIPVITASQLRRDYEEIDKELSNVAMCDSVEKIRASDYILMFRRTDKFVKDANDQQSDTLNRKKKTKNFLTAEKLMNYLGVSDELMSTKYLSDFVSIVMAEHGIQTFNLPDYQKYYEVIKRAEKLNNIENELEDTIDDEFVIIPADIDAANNDYNDEFVNKQIIHPWMGKPDYMIFNELISTVEYAFTKSKDNLNSIRSKYYYMTTYKNTSERNLKYIAGALNIRFRNGEYDPTDLILEYADKYILYSNFNYRYYDIVDLQKIEDDFKDGIKKFAELYKLITDPTRITVLKNFLNDYEKAAGIS
jgi:replicative DNA helicase